MVAGCQNIDAGREKIIAYGRRHTEAAGGVLTVHDQEIQRQLFTKDRHLFDHRLARGAADNIPQKQNAHHPNPSLINPVHYPRADRMV